MLSVGYVIWGLIVVLALAVCYASSRPGNRRCKKDKDYSGPERRKDPTVRDFFSQPIFTRPSCNSCDKINPHGTGCDDCPKN